MKRERERDKKMNRERERDNEMKRERDRTLRQRVQVCYSK